MAQKIIVTTCPWKDYKTGKWMLSAMMNIQLETTQETTLAAFPDIINWMEKLQQGLFYVQWGAAAPKEIKPLTAKWNPDLYQKLFHTGIKVKGFAPLNMTGLTIKSFPTLHISQFILNTYKEIGNIKMNELPKASFFTEDYIKLNPIARTTLVATKPITGLSRKIAQSDFIKRGHPGTVSAKQQLASKKVITFNPLGNADADFGQFHNFFARNNNISKKGPLPIAVKDFEYHDIFSVITSYPVILRKLGLIIDFELPAAPPAGKSTVRIVPANLNFSEEVNIVAPNTSYEATATGFYASPKPGSSIEKGVLKVNTNEFDIVTFDSDAAAIKLAIHAESIFEKTGSKLADKSNYLDVHPVDNEIFKGIILPTDERGPAIEANDDDTEEGLPSLRTAGIGLVKNGLAATLFEKLNINAAAYQDFIKPINQLKSTELFNTNKNATIVNFKEPGAFKKNRDAAAVKLNTIIINPVVLPPATQTLFADDIVQGYRMDIAYEDKPGQWFSLHKRKNTYSFIPVAATNGENISLGADEVVDEGCIHLSLVKDENDDDPTTEKINDVLARWQGWSLAVPKPGKGINEGTGDEIVSTDEAEKEKYKLKNNVPFRMQVNAEPAPRTLPMLRFGKTYKLKVRTVDIAGNSLPHDVVPENASVAIRNGIKYLRYEPLPVPVIVATDEIVTKANQNIRDRDGESLEHMVIRSNVGQSSEQYEKNNPTNIYDPNSLQQNKVQNTITWLHEAVRHIKAPRCSQQMAETHGMFDDAFTNAAKAKEAYDFINLKDPVLNEKNEDRKGAIAKTIDTNLIHAYLADPMAAGVVFVMKSTTSFESNWKKDQLRKFSFYFDEEVTNSNVNKPFKDQWKSPKSFRIKLIEGNADTEWNAAERMLYIRLPKSAEIEIKYASFWRPDDVDNYNAMQPIIGQGNNKGISQEFARKGLHWMFSPWRNIRLVHAVQQPLEKPAIDANSLSVAQRTYHDSFAKLATMINVHGSSTDKVDIEASWTEMIDDIKNPDIVTATFNTHVATLPVAYSNKKLICAASPVKSLNSEQRQFPLFYHPFNDTKHRWVNYNGVATTRYREYFTGIIETGNKTGKPVNLIQTGDVVKLNILSTARPATPLIEYVVPSFNWVTNEKSTEITRMRTGNIRVYLQRPWYSSGDEEMLGVILPIKNIMLNQYGKLHCTVWGKDPVFNSPELNGTNYPQVENFPFAAAYDTVSLAEDENTKMAIAAYKVLFDADKQLHYADIPIQINQAYFPFVRLSVARYQPHSLKTNGKDCCLGPSSIADWLQVVPVRYTALYFKNSKAAFEVALRGTAPFTFNNQEVPVAGGRKVPSRIKINVTVTDTAVPKTDDTYIKFNDRSTRILFVQDYYLLREQFKGSQIEFVQRVDIANEFSGKPYRVEIREYELHEFDPIRATQEANKNFTDPNKKITNVTRYDERLVFMDVIEVNG